MTREGTAISEQNAAAASAPADPQMQTLDRPPTDEDVWTERWEREWKERADRAERAERERAERAARAEREYAERAARAEREYAERADRAEQAEREERERREARAQRADEEERALRAALTGGAGHPDTEEPPEGADDAPAGEPSRPRSLERPRRRS